MIKNKEWKGKGRMVQLTCLCLDGNLSIVPFQNFIWHFKVHSGIYSVMQVNIYLYPDYRQTTCVDEDKAPFKSPLLKRNVTNSEPDTESIWWYSLDGGSIHLDQLDQADEYQKENSNEKNSSPPLIPFADHQKSSLPASDNHMQTDFIGENYIQKNMIAKEGNTVKFSADTCKSIELEQ